MRASEIRAMSEDQRAKRMNELGEELARLNMQRHAGRLEKPSELIKAKRDMARLMTVERELDAAKESEGS